MSLRPESKTRARALQLLYAWELQEHPELGPVADRMHGLARGRFDVGDRAEAVAREVVARREALDAEIEPAIEGWDYGRVGVIEKNILRLAVHELSVGDTPAKVVIDEALRLTHWFAGSRAHLLINGVLDRLARERRLL